MLGRTILLSMANWKTTVLGIAMLIHGFLGMILIPLLDGDPETLVNWNVAIPELFAGLTGLLARDQDKSSQSTGLT